MLAAATLAVGLLAAWRQTRAGDRVGALVAVGALGALISPIAWSHHWLWTPVFAWWLWTAERLIGLGVQPGLLYAVLTSPFVIVGAVSLVVLCRRPGSSTVSGRCRSRPAARRV